MAEIDGSILDTIKLLCRLDPEDTSYDSELVTHTNTIFFVLQQLGIGPKAGFTILGADEKWSEFVAEDYITAVRSYMGLRVQLLFDPPSTGPATQAMERQAEQLEWRLYIQMEGVRWDTMLETS